MIFLVILHAKLVDMTNSSDIFSLETTLSSFFDCITKSNQTASAYPFLQAMTSIFHGQTTSLVIMFDLEIDFKGTMIMVRIPAQVPDGFNLYNYMS